MKRDMDLVRRILFGLEVHDDNSDLRNFKIEGVEVNTLSGHVHMMAEAGLIDAHEQRNRAESNWSPKRVTWRGHEFLDAIRNDTLWSKTKKVVLEKTGGLSLAAIEAYAKHILKEILGIGTGQ